MRKSFRKYLWYIEGFLKKRGRLFIYSFITAVFAIFTALKFFPFLTASLSVNRLTTGSVGSHTMSNLPPQVQNLIAEGLTAVDESGRPHPRLAAKWEVSDNGKIYQLELKPDIVFHDGRKLKSGDINYNIKDVSIEYPAPDVIKISLRDPFSPLPVLLSRPLIKKGILGTGPYKFGSVKLNGGFIEKITLMPAFNPALPVMIYKFYSTEETLVTAFKLGEISKIENLHDLTPLKDWKNIKVSETIDYRRPLILSFNLTDKILSDRVVRLNLIQSISPLFKDPKQAATGPLPPVSWAYNFSVRKLDFDSAAGKTLAKYAPLELTLSTYQPYTEIADKIAASWRAYGMNVNVKIESARPAGYQILLSSWELPLDPDQYPLWHSTQKDTAIANFSNPKIDKLLEDGRRALDINERMKIYADFQKYFVEESPAAFLYYPKLYTITRK